MQGLLETSPGKDFGFYSEGRGSHWRGVARAACERIVCLGHCGLL